MRKIHFGNLYKIILRLLKVQYGENLNLYGLPVIVKTGKARILIGNNCHIKSAFLSNLIGLSQRCILCAKEDGIIEIGNNVGLSGVTIYAKKYIKIGDNCIIGGNVKILDNDFHPVDPVVRISKPSDGFDIQPVLVGENVFIGCNALILKGVKIGDNSVIGAGSVVVRDVPANCVVAGNPAKIIKTLGV